MRGWCLVLQRHYFLGKTVAFRCSAGAGEVAPTAGCRASREEVH